jgi:hypothetical protein
MLRYLEQLRASFRESGVNTTLPMWELLVAVFAWTAKQERERIGVKRGARRPAGRTPAARRETACEATVNRLAAVRLEFTDA